jgi:hypothetical protein
MKQSKQECAAIGQQAQCCVLPVVRDPVLSVLVLGITDLGLLRPDKLSSASQPFRWERCLRQKTWRLGKKD